MAIKIIKEIGLDNDYWKDREKKWKDFNDQHKDDKYGKDNKIDKLTYTDHETAEKILDEVEALLRTYKFKTQQYLSKEPDELKTALKLADKGTVDNYDNFNEELYNGKVSGKIDMKRELKFNNPKNGKDGIYKIHVIVDVLVRSVLKDKSTLDTSKKASGKDSDKFKALIVSNLEALPFDDGIQLLVKVSRLVNETIKKQNKQDQWIVEIADGNDVFSLKDDIELVSEAGTEETE